LPLTFLWRSYNTRVAYFCARQEPASVLPASKVLGGRIQNRRIRNKNGIRSYSVITLLHRLQTGTAARHGEIRAPHATDREVRAGAFRRNFRRERGSFISIDRNLDLCGWQICPYGSPRAAKCTCPARRPLPQPVLLADSATDRSFLPHLLILKPMKVRLFSNGVAIPVSPFIARFIFQVSAAVIRSLKAPQPVRSAEFLIDPGDVFLRVDGAPVPLDHSRGFARVIVRDTLGGMVRHLKGVDPDAAFEIELDWRDID
jgi:hypothetical protein